MAPSVSVVIPVHNGEKYMKECLDSIVGQSLRNIQIICVNDGSSDNSLTILEEYCAKDSRIKIISQLASNAGHARNVGLKFAEGEYISFLDCDDWFELDMLKSMYTIGKKSDADIVFCKARTFDHQSRIHSKKSFSIKSRIVPKNRIFSCRDISEDAFQFCRTAAWDKLYKTSFLRNEHIEFQEQPRMNDCFFSTTANIRAKKMIVCNHFFVHYRINTGTSITSKPEKNYSCTLQTFDKIQNFLTNDEMNLYKKSWKNFVLNGIVNEFMFFSSDVAYQYYLQLKEYNFGLDDFKRPESYDPEIFDLYKKYISLKYESKEEFVLKFHEFVRKMKLKRQRPKWIKSLKNKYYLVKSHSLKFFILR